MKIKESIEVKVTTNRYVFNKAYKHYLEKTGKIRCSYCSYHRGENATHEVYGGWGDKLKFPNWKLCTKNKKQWEKKKLKVRELTNRKINSKTYKSIKW